MKRMIMIIYEYIKKNVIKNIESYIYSDGADYGYEYEPESDGFKLSKIATMTLYEK